MGIVKKLSITGKKNSSSSLKKNSSNTSLKTLDDAKSVTNTPVKKTQDTVANPALDDAPSAPARVQLAVNNDTIVTSTVDKPTRSAHVGIGIQKNKESESILISSISKAGLFAGSNLKEGRRVLKINGLPCPKDLSEAKSVLVSTVGQLSIEAGDIIKTVGAVTKPTKATKVGISLRKDDDTNAIMIFAISANGLFSATDLRVGQMVLKINGKSVPKDVAAIARIISEATSTLTIEAADVQMGEEEHKAVMISLSKKLSILTEANRSLSMTELTLKNEVSEKEAKIEKHSSLLGEATAEKEALLKKKQKMEKDMSAKDSKIALLEAKIAEVDSKISSISGENQDLSKSQSSLRTSLSQKDLQIVELQAKVTTLDTERSELSSKKSAADSEVSAHSSKVANLEVTLSEKDKQIAELESKIAALEYKSDIVDEVSTEEEEEEEINEPSAETATAKIGRILTPTTATVGVVCLASVGFLLSKRK